MTTWLAFDVAGGGRDDDAVAVLAHAGDAGRHEHLAVAFAHPLGQPLADLAIVDDARLGNVDRADAGGVRLELGQAVLVDLRAVHAVGLAPLVNPLEGRQLAVVDGDDHLAADLVGDPLGRAKLLHRLLAGPAVDRLERARLVIDARVQHARVVAGLMMGQLGFFLEHHDAPAGVLPCDLIGRGETDNSSANNRNIHLLHRSSDFFRGVKIKGWPSEQDPQFQPISPRSFNHCESSAGVTP